jgi:hypothetical protein
MLQLRLHDSEADERISNDVESLCIEPTRYSSRESLTRTPAVALIPHRTLRKQRPLKTVGGRDP